MKLSTSQYLLFMWIVRQGDCMINESDWKIVGPHSQYGVMRTVGALCRKDLLMVVKPNPRTGERRWRITGKGTTEGTKLLGVSEKRAHG